MTNIGSLNLTDYGQWLLVHLDEITFKGDGGIGVADYAGPPIEYKKGVCAANLIPFGRLSVLVHFEDEPEVFYSVGGTAINRSTMMEADAVAAANKWRNFAIGE